MPATSVMSTGHHRLAFDSSAVAEAGSGNRKSQRSLPPAIVWVRTRFSRRPLAMSRSCSQNTCWQKTSSPRLLMYSARRHRRTSECVATRVRYMLHSPVRRCEEEPSAEPLTKACPCEAVSRVEKEGEGIQRTVEPMHHIEERVSEQAIGVRFAVSAGGQAIAKRKQVGAHLEVQATNRRTTRWWPDIGVSSPLDDHSRRLAAHLRSQGHLRQPRHQWRASISHHLQRSAPVLSPPGSIGPLHERAKGPVHRPPVPARP